VTTVAIAETTIGNSDRGILIAAAATAVAVVEIVGTTTPRRLLLDRVSILTRAVPRK